MSGATKSESLVEKLASYRSLQEVPRRTEEGIQFEVDKLISRMSIAQKIGQLCQCLGAKVALGSDVKTDRAEKIIAEGRAGSVLGADDSERIFELQRIAVEESELGIPLFFNLDIIHGFHTIFPVPLAWSCSWDPAAIKEACAISAKEAAITGITYNHGPMVDISRDPRWGRVVEGAGEDPYLGSLIAQAQVEGFQGNDLLSPETMIACLKHFIGYGASEGGRDYNTVDFSERMLRELYLPPFKAGLRAGAGSVMTAFNIYDGVPATANRFLMKDLLREELAFEGILLSDFGAVDEIVVHGAAKDAKEAALLSMQATMDIEMVTTAYESHLFSLIEEGHIQEEQLNQAVKRILTYKYKIGIMDDPYRYIQPEKQARYDFCDEHLNASRELARKSIVLLKNDGILPLAKQSGGIAIIGPLADSKDLLGPWQGSRYHNRTTTLEEGIRFAAPDLPLRIARGCKVQEEITGGFEEVELAVKNSDVVLLALGETSMMSGEAASRMSIELPVVQQRLADLVFTLGKPTIVILTNGRPLALGEFDERAHAILETWFLGSCAGSAIADVLFGDYNPTGRLTMSFPRNEGQIPVYYNHMQTGRPVTETNRDEMFLSKYLDGPNTPMYPFGYGLSYTTFCYSDISLDRTVMNCTESITASISITNTGERIGEETIQLYLQDVHGSVVRPVKMLKDYKKVVLAPGETKSASFVISEEALKYHTYSLDYKAEAGLFRVFIGANALDTRMAEFELVVK